MTSTPCLISVIIPCYNYGRFLPDAVNSVLGQKKDGLAVEIIVVDDGSTDDTAAVAQGLGSSIQYIYQKNQGPSAARNSGIRVARGDYLVFLDADDLLTAGTLASHIENFAAHPELDVSVCLSLQIFENEDGKTASYLWPLKCAHLDMHLCHSNISPIHTFMLRANAAQELGFFDPGLQACEDQDYWLRCAALGKRIGPNPEGLVIYRKHNGSLSDSRTQQLAYDAAIRFKISMLLENKADFPQAGKFYGWLAQAAGTLGSAYGLSQSAPDFARKLLDESAKAVLKAATLATREKTEDAHLILAERYFAGEYLLRARNLAALSSRNLENAISFLTKRYPQLAALDNDSLEIRQKKNFPRLCCDYEQMQAMVRKRMTTAATNIFESDKQRAETTIPRYHMGNS